MVSEFGFWDTGFLVQVRGLQVSCSNRPAGSILSHVLVSYVDLVASMLEGCAKQTQDECAVKQYLELHD